MNKDYYSLLNLKPNATFLEIEAAYNTFKAANQISPDITKAYQTLSNPEQRKEYDIAQKNENTTIATPVANPNLAQTLELNAIQQQQLLTNPQQQILLRSEQNNKPAPASAPQPEIKLEPVKTTTFDPMKPKDQQVTETIELVPTPTPFPKKPSPFDK